MMKGKSKFSFSRVTDRISFNTLKGYYNFLNVQRNSKTETLKQLDQLDFYKSGYIVWLI